MVAGDRRGLSLEPELGFSLDSWSRHRARLLEPGTAVRVPGQAQVHQTTYVADALLVRRGDSGQVLDVVTRIAKRFGYHVARDPQADTDRAWLADLDLTDAQRTEITDRWVERVRLLPDRERPALVEPDAAWRILQQYRLDTPADGRDQVSLEHLVSATTTGIGGTPYTNSHGVGGTPYTNSHGVGGTPYTNSHGVSGYGIPGLGGRQPVNWVGPAPHARFELGPASQVRLPVVAILDTGVGAHPWLDDGHVQRGLEVEGVPLDVPASTPDSEIAGWTDPLLGGLDPDAGHGTFIAGLVRQACPDARVLAVRLFHGDGVVGEWDLLRALQLLTVRQALALNGDARYDVVDVLSLSLGYYHEQPEDLDFSSLLLEWVRLLGRYAVCIVTSAGNDATLRPMYPGAFAPGGSVAVDPEVLPVVCVGAENPDGTVALFSNAGPWVGYLRPGASLVSTYPVTVDASTSPAAELSYGGVRRASIDPDDYSAGFAVWSGTSFAAPVFAGEMAARLLERYAAGDDDRDLATAHLRARKVLETMPRDGRS